MEIVFIDKLECLLPDCAVELSLAVLLLQLSM